MSVLSAIASFFKRKKDDELITQPTVNPVVATTNFLQGAAQTASNVGGNVLKAISSFKPLPFGPTLADVKPTGTFTLGQAGTFAKDVIQTFPREAAAIAPTIGETIGKSFEIKPTEGTPIEQLGKKIVFGTEPVKSYQQQGREAKEFIRGIPLPEQIKKPLESAGPFLPVIGAAIDISTLGGGRKLTVETGEELATVIKRSLPKLTSTIDETSGALKVAWKDVSSLLSKLSVDKKILSNLEKGKVVEGEGFVLQRIGDDLITTIDDAFKEVTPVVKKGVEFARSVVNKTEKAPDVKYVEPKVFADTLEDAVPGGRKTVSAIKLPEYARATGAINRTQVEAVKSSILAGDKINPVVLDPKGNMLDGAHRLVALKELGVKEIDTVIQKVKPLEKIAALKKTGTEIAEQQKATVELASDIRSKFSKEMIDNINRLKSAAKAKAFQEGDIETLRKSRYGPLVDQVVEAVRELPVYRELDDSAALKVALELPTKEATRVKQVTELQQAKVLEKQLAADTKAFTQETGLGAPAQTEAEFNRVMREADSYVKQEFPMSPAKHEALINSRIRTQEKAGQKLVKEWSESYDQGTISLEGNGDLKLPSKIIENVPEYKDANRAVLNVLTPERIIEDVAGKDAPALKEFFFGRVAKDTTALQNDLKSIREAIKTNIVETLGIKPGGPEDALVFRYGEGRMTLEELKAAAPDKWQDIVKADTYFRNLYDALLTRINEVIGAFGYDPVLRRNDYYTHYQELGNLFDNLGMVFRSSELPAWLNGLTADFRPGKNFFRFAQPRLGQEFTESAIGAIDKYLEPALNQIYRTDTIQRGRLLERALRDSMELRDDVDPTHITNFLAWLGDYVNTLSGKKSLLARGSEALLGRPVYAVIDAIKRKTSANLVGGNLSSALTNFIPLTQAFATTDKPSFVKGLISAATSPIAELNNMSIDGIQSVFLRNRFGIQKLAPTLWENVADKGTWLFQTIDKFVANTIVGGKYYEGLTKGLDQTAAMARADTYAASVMADRSFGQLPQIFQNQGLLGLLTQFQVEVSNQLQFMFRDIPKNSPTFAASASALGQIALYSYLFNNVFQYLTGRRPAFDPIDIAVSSYEEATSTKAPDEKRKAIVKKVADNLPFVQVFTQGGRMPIAAGIPSVSDLENAPISAILKFGAMYAAPVGGYQAYKTGEGLLSFAKGYETDSSGHIKWPVDPTLMNLIRGTLFGKYSFPEASEFFKEGKTALGTDQTIIFKQLQATDPERASAYYDNLMSYREMGEATRSIAQAKEQLKLVIGDPKASAEDKQSAYADFLATVEDLRRQMIGVESNDPSLGLTSTQFANIDKQLIASLAEGLPFTASDLSKSLGTLIQPKGKGVSLKGIKKPSVKKLSIKPVKFTPKSVKEATPTGVAFAPPGTPTTTGVTLPSQREAPNPPRPRVPTVRGLQVA